MTEKLIGLLGVWGKPPDQASMFFAIAGGLLVLCSLYEPLAKLALSQLDRLIPSRTKTPWSLALAAALLSLGYIAIYLRGGPRIVDATTYFLEGRTIANGALSFEVLDPSASFRGRFLLYGDHHAAGVFPPGYPLLLAVGFVFGAPLVIGPLLAAVLAIVTAALVRTLGGGETEARFGAVLSLLCAALRYHTADTMSHGAAALGMSLTLLLALRGSPALAGLALGWLISTRIPSGLGAAIVAIVIFRRDRRALLRLALGTLPFLLLLIASQKAATGSYFSFAQSAYYERSDGPPGCFRYGFGQGIGCVFEHGDVVRNNLSRGYGFIAALLTTLRRLWHHADDVLDGWPLALLVLPALVARARASAAGRAFGLAIVLQVLVYVPFYFDGNYPGGGARHLADVLPLEHALVAMAIAHGFRFATFERRALALGGACALFFGVHMAHAHVQLRDRDGGRPMFEPDLLPKTQSTGVLFVDTDHGFNLAYDPSRTRSMVAARWRDDSHDRLLFERLGSPPSWRYKFGEEKPLSPWMPPAATDELGRETWRFEAESDWPPLSQSGGYAIPGWAVCASNGRTLDVVATDALAHAVISIPIPRADRWRVVPRVATASTGRLRLIGPKGTLAEWQIAQGDGCAELAGVDIDVEAHDLTLEIETGGRFALDRVVLGRPPVAP